ncbi:MAG: sulfatase-like hydrolase/transferase, partial [Pontiellaceae bacterium]|nr:sulfatase-like hydrolase/transferase [Pontiellaceae bacterium]
EAAVTFEQILVENRGYVAEHYGKWHMPEICNWSTNGATRVMQYNDFNFVSNTPLFNNSNSSLDYDAKLASVAGGLSTTQSPGMQKNTYSQYPYVTDRIDTRYGLAPYATNVVSQPDQQGRDTLPANRTPSYFEGTAALAALDRLATNPQPFVLTASFHNPHAPMVATGLYYDYYKALEAGMFLPPNLSGADMANSAWSKFGDPDYQDPAKVKEWMVSYYALCEEVDHYVGLLLDKLDEKGIADNTLVIFAADHGESLGAHGCREKSKFWEEAARVPLLMRLPGRIQAGSTVNESVTTLDCFATIMDYLGASTYDKGDGKSLRRFIEKTNYNKDYDDEAIVTEWDFRTPTNSTALDRSLGGEINFLCKKGPWKLMMTKKASSTKKDMLYNIETDPYEMFNYLGTNGMKAAEAVVGKAEHLKCLLMEWMQRMDGGTNKYYSDPKWNAGEGQGDLAEIKARRTWKTLNIWVSDTAIKVGQPVNVSGQLTRNEYIYLGRTTSGTLTVSNITVQGANAGLFQLSEFTSGTITSGNYKRVKLTYRPPSASQTVTDARVVISHSAGADKVITVTAQSGSATATVPWVTNLTLSAAGTSITNAGLVVGSVSSNYHATVAAGKIFSQTPGGGVVTNSGTAVNLAVSRGPSTGTTVTFYSVGVHDGYVDESSETSNVGGTNKVSFTDGSAIRAGDTGARRQRKGIVSFDCSSLPDTCTITAATLKLKRGGGIGDPTSLGSLVADVKNVNGGWSDNAALQNSDFEAAASASSVATLSYPAATNAWSTGSLNAAGLTKITKTTNSYTQYRIRFTTDDDNDTADDYLGFYSGENATAANRPVLEVTYQ